MILHKQTNKRMAEIKAIFVKRLLILAGMSCMKSRNNPPMKRVEERLSRLEHQRNRTHDKA